MGKLFRSVFKIMIGAGLFMAGWYAREFFADDSEYDFDDDWQGGDPYGKCGDCDDFFDEGLTVTKANLTVVTRLRSLK